MCRSYRAGSAERRAVEASEGTASNGRTRHAQPGLIIALAALAINIGIRTMSDDAFRHTVYRGADPRRR